MVLSGAGRRFLGATGVALLATSLFAACIGLRAGGPRATLWVDYFLTPVAAGLACALCLTAGARHHGRMRLFWSLLGAATAAWTLGEVAWGYQVLVLGETDVPVPSLADVGYLAAIPLTVAALVVHPATSPSTIRRTRSLLDGLVLATALLFLSWTLALGPAWRDADLGTWTGVIGVAYPFGDVVIVFLVVLAIRGMAGGNRRAFWCLLVALLGMAIADSTTFSYLAADDYTTPGLIDTGWFAAYLGIALAAYSAQSDRAVVRPSEGTPPSLASLVSPLLTVLLALSVAAAQVNLGHRLDRTAWLMALALIVLVLVRQALMLVEALGPGHATRGGAMARLADVALGELPPGPVYAERSGRKGHPR